MDRLLTYSWNQMQEWPDHDVQLEPFSTEHIKQILRFQKSHPDYTETPLVRLEGLAQELGLRHLFVKDESQRFGLNAFKVLGGIYVVGRYVAEKIGFPLSELSFETLTSKKVKRQTGRLTFVSATDGNHGRGIAWAARELGHKAIIYLPKGAAEVRVQAIRDEGAEAVVTDRNYDDTVRLVAEKAEENNWVVVQDTSWEGYEQIPQWIMQGYASMTQEIVNQLGAYSSDLTTPTHVFLQAGVGSYAASVVAFFVNYYGKKHPKFILVEPHKANCYYQSFAASDHAIHTVGGDLQTIMAGLSCGEPNPQAWDILKKYSEASFSCHDRVSALGMRILGNPLGDDERIISGESGSVTTGLLYSLMTDPEYEDVRDEFELDDQANVVLINTEGDTDAAHYRDVVWEGRHPFTS